MNDEKELIERVKELEGLVETLIALLTLITVDLGWSNI